VIRSRTITRICPCGARFAVVIRGAGRPTKFCSVACRDGSGHTTVRSTSEKTCAICGDQFIASDARLECCGRTCGHILGKRRSDATRSENARHRLARRCEACCDEFVARNPSGAARRGETREGRFCSRKCQAVWRTRRPPLQLELFGGAERP
jgi:ribosomal protein L24E